MSCGASEIKDRQPLVKAQGDEMASGGMKAQSRDRGFAIEGRIRLPDRAGDGVVAQIEAGRVDAVPDAGRGGAGSHEVALLVQRTRHKSRRARSRLLEHRLAFMGGDEQRAASQERRVCRSQRHDVAHED
jgi:hypothetical protein